MKKFTLIFTFFLGVSPILGADSAEESCNSMTSSLLDQLIVQIRSLEFDKQSQEV